MIFKETKIEGAFVIGLKKHRDERGSFARTWCREEFRLNGIKAQPVQANTAFSSKKGTLRGMHYQAEPYAEAKLVRCIRGALFDVMVDLRPDSPSYTQWIGVELTSVNDRMLFVPEGCAHGYQSLSDDTEVCYLSSQFYSPESERGLRWNDPAININWPISENTIISEKDQSWPDYRIG